jgi:cell division protein FtsI/penicillin-binding protein 2
MTAWFGVRAPKRKKGATPQELRLRVFRFAVVAGLAAIATRLFVIQVLSHDFYAAIASNQHGIFEELFPERGTIYLRDPKAAAGVFPAAVNKSLAVVYADTRKIVDPAAAAKSLAGMLGADEAELLAKLTRQGDPYEPLKRKVPDDVVAKLKTLRIEGIGFAKEQFRFYPERSVAAHITGFLGSNEKGERVGRYGIEGHWNAELSGNRGFLEAEKDPFGRWIGSGERNVSPAEDGQALVLTIDRTVQYVACEKLKAAVAKHGADGGSVVILDPKTGAVLAMCNAPDFDPNTYSEVQDIRVFNNAAIFSPYEPGSIFKPITMASAIDAGSVSPSTTYEDDGQVVIGPYTIRNSDGKANGVQTMTQVLEKSLNTGVIFAVRKLGADRFRGYVERFGFGSPTGVELDTEAAGDIDSLRKRGDIWSATASYGQGISATPLQLAAAYAAIANGGKLMKPYVVAETRRADGTVVKTEPEAVRQVITKRAASLVAGMLVRVVENGHGKRAGDKRYYVAGKTGTAQIARKDGKGYEEGATIGSFAGFAPVDDPRFVMVVKIDRPKDVQWAESTAAPLFGEIARFLLQYMEVPPERK